MKRTLNFCGFALLMSLVTITTFAQSVTNTSYFVENATHRHLLNPSLAPSRGYFDIPGLGEFYLNNESNLKFTNFIYPANDASEGKLRTFLHPSINADEFLQTLNGDQYMRLDLRNSLFSFGYWTGKSSFITFEVATRTKLALNLPEDLFGFFKKGMSDGAGNTYHLDNLSLGASVIGEASLGYSADLSDRLRFGLKGKVLVGGAKILAKLETMEIAMTPDQWSVTTEGKIEAYGKGLSLVKDNEGNITNIGEFNTADLNIAGTGLAFDLGFEYTILPKLKLSMALIDVGGIKWNKDNVKTATSSGSVTFNGIDNFNPDETGQEDMQTQLDDMKESLLSMSKFKEVTTTEDILDKLNPMLNIGVEYSLKRISLGGLMTTRFMDNERYTEYTASVNLKPLRMFNLSGSYSIMHGMQETFGFAVGFIPALFNLYVSCDYVPTKFSPQYIPLNTTNTNIQIGVSFPLGKRKAPVVVEEEEEEEPVEEEFIIVK
jgi:hypothetical protein